MTSNIPRAVLLGIDNHPRTVAAIQSLSRAGVPVVGVDPDPAALGFTSRGLSERIRIDRDPERALADLEALGARAGGVLMPTNDHYLILVAKNLERLSRHFFVTTPSWEVLGPLMDVAQCYAMAKEIGIRAPGCFKPETEEQMRSIVSSLDLERREYLLKTVPGSAPADTRTGRFTKVAGADRSTIERDCREIFSRTGEFPSILEVIPGTADRCIGVCMVVDLQHEPVLSYSVRRLRLHTYSKGGRFVHPYEMGANVYCETVHDDEAAEAARRLVLRARFHGPIAVEFRRDPADESLVLIKADPRFVRATSLSTKIGLDVPSAVYRVFTNAPVTRGEAYADGVAWIWLTAYLDTLWDSRRDRSLRGELLELARNARRIKSVAYLDLRDPRPFLSSLSRWAWKWVKLRFAILRHRSVNWARRPRVSMPSAER